MASSDAENIVKRLMPEVEIVRRRREDAVDTNEGQDEDRPRGGPSLADIKGKYAAESDAQGGVAYHTMSHDAADVAEDDIEVVQVKPPGPLSDESGPQVRAIIVSKKLGKIIGKQG